MEMKATHKLILRKTRAEYLVSLDGDTYYWKHLEDDFGWKGPFSMFEDDYMLDEDWIVKKINTFKGNK